MHCDPGACSDGTDDDPTAPPDDSRLEYTGSAAPYAACRTIDIEFPGRPPSYEEVVSNPDLFKAK